MSSPYVTVGPVPEHSGGGTGRCSVVLRAALGAYFVYRSTHAWPGHAWPSPARPSPARPSPAAPSKDHRALNRSSKRAHHDKGTRVPVGGGRVRSSGASRAVVRRTRSARVIASRGFRRGDI